MYVNPTATLVHSFGGGPNAAKCLLCMNKSEFHPNKFQPHTLLVPLWRWWTFPSIYLIIIWMNSIWKIEAPVLYDCCAGWPLWTTRLKIVLAGSDFWCCCRIRRIVKPNFTAGLKRAHMPDLLILYVGGCCTKPCEYLLSVVYVLYCTYWLGLEWFWCTITAAELSMAHILEREHES